MPDFLRSPPILVVYQGVVHIMAVKNSVPNCGCSHTSDLDDPSILYCMYWSMGHTSSNYSVHILLMHSLQQHYLLVEMARICWVMFLYPTYPTHLCLSCRLILTNSHLIHQSSSLLQQTSNIINSGIRRSQVYLINTPRGGFSLSTKLLRICNHYRN